MEKDNVEKQLMILNFLGLIPIFGFFIVFFYGALKVNKRLNRLNAIWFMLLSVLMLTAVTIIVVIVWVLCLMGKTDTLFVVLTILIFIVAVIVASVLTNLILKWFLTKRKKN